MQRMLVFNALFGLGFMLTLGGCKLALVVVEGGELASESGTYTCIEGSNCVIEVTGTNFNETFVAIPGAGYVFSHWLAGDSLLCGGSTDPRCVTDNRLLAGNPAAEAFIGTDATFYLLPVFVAAESPPGGADGGLPAALQATFDGSCGQCHVTGVLGAPRLHDERAWAPRLAKGMDALLRSVKNGFGGMPAGGRCGNCSDADYRAMISYMSGPAN